MMGDGATNPDLRDAGYICITANSFNVRVLTKKIRVVIHKTNLTYGSPGGEGGIRTLGSHRGYNGFRDRPDRPLRHLSELQAHIILEFGNRDNGLYNSKVVMRSGKWMGGIVLFSSKSSFSA